MIYPPDLLSNNRSQLIAIIIYNYADENWQEINPVSLAIINLDNVLVSKVLLTISLQQLCVKLDVIRIMKQVNNCSVNSGPSLTTNINNLDLFNGSSIKDSSPKIMQSDLNNRPQEIQQTCVLENRNVEVWIEGDNEKLAYCNKDSMDGNKKSCFSEVFVELDIEDLFKTDFYFHRCSKVLMYPNKTKRSRLPYVTIKNKKAEKVSDHASTIDMICDSIFDKHQPYLIGQKNLTRKISHSGKKSCLITLLNSHQNDKTKDDILSHIRSRRIHDNKAVWRTTVEQCNVDRHSYVSSKLSNPVTSTVYESAVSITRNDVKPMCQVMLAVPNFGNRNQLPSIAEKTNSTESMNALLFLKLLNLWFKEILTSEVKICSINVLKALNKFKFQQGYQLYMPNEESSSLYTYFTLSSFNLNN